jgi:hypothetical protein
MRRVLAGLLILVLGLAGGSLLSAPARAQARPSVRLRLVSESATVALHRPLRLSFEAANDGPTAIDGLSAELFVMAPATSRSLYAETITSDPTLVVLFFPFTETGALEPGQTRRFSITQSMDALDARGDSALYPIRVELRSHDQLVGSIRTPMIYLFEHPKVPLNLEWTWVLSEPLQIGPTGTFLPGPIEADLAPGGRLDSMAAALVASGLSSDLPELQRLGHAVTADALRRPATATVAWPPADQLDTLSLPSLIDGGSQTLLVGNRFLPAQRFASPPTVQLASGDRSIVTVLPDPDVASLAATQMEDPVLAAHIALGAMAAVWFELPGTPGRGVSLYFSGDGSLPGTYLRTLVQLVQGSPWLAAVPASRFASLVPPVTVRQIPVRATRTYDPRLVSGLRDARGVLANFAATAPAEASLVRDLRSSLLPVESGAALADPSIGERAIDSVRARVAKVYRGITIPTSKVTLTSRSGTFPLTLDNRSGTAVTVKLRFVSDRRIQFPGGAERTIEVPGSSRTLAIKVRALTTGRIPIKVLLLSQSEGVPPQTIAQRLLVIRSTAYNLVALLITVGAAVFLLAWWGRRFLPRRKA